MKSFLAALPVAILVFVAGGWLWLSAATEPSPAPSVAAQVGLVAIFVCLVVSAIVVAFRKRLPVRTVAVSIHPVRRDLALACAVIAVPLLIFNQVAVATSGHLYIPTRNGPDPHYYLLGTPFPFLVFYIASACFPAMVSYLLVLMWRVRRHGR